MKRLQNIIFYVSLVLIVADCLYPPYVVVLEVRGRQIGSLPRGRRFLLTQGFNQSDADYERRLGVQTPSPDSQFFFTRINYRQLGLQVLVIAFVGIVSIIALKLISKARTAESATH